MTEPKNPDFTRGTVKDAIKAAEEARLKALENGWKNGGSPKVKHNGRMYTVHTGPRGGKYIMVKGEKVYL